MKENHIYLAYAEEAAVLERNRNYHGAAEYWGKAAPQASLRINQRWAEHRHDLCRRLALRQQVAKAKEAKALETKALESKAPEAA